MTRLMIAAILIGSLFAATMSSVNAAPPIVDPIAGMLENVEFDRSAGENGIYTATLTRSWHVSTIALEFTEEMTPSFDLDNGAVDVYTETFNDDDGTISQGNRYYRFYTLDAMADRVVRVVVGVKGQEGDSSFDTFYADHGNYCTVLAVIDNGADPISGTIYTRLACTMTQDTATNLFKTYDDSILFVNMAYGVFLPVIAN